MCAGGEKHKRCLQDVVGYCRLVEVDDVEIAMAAQRGFNNGVLGRGRLYHIGGEFVYGFNFVAGMLVRVEHAVNWYQDKVRKTLEVHTAMKSE